MAQCLELASPVVRARAGFHADQAARLLLEKREKLAATELVAHENAPLLVDTVDLENTLGEVDTDRGKLGHGWLLSSGRQHPNYDPARRREQEPSTPSVENVWQFLRDNWLSNRVFIDYDDIVAHCCEAWNKLVNQPWKIISIGMRDWAHRF